MSLSNRLFLICLITVCVIPKIKKEKTTTTSKTNSLCIRIAKKEIVKRSQVSVQPTNSNVSADDKSEAIPRRSVSSISLPIEEEDGDVLVSISDIEVVITLRRLFYYRKS